MIAMTMITMTTTMMQMMMMMLMMMTIMTMTMTMILYQRLFLLLVFSIVQTSLVSTYDTILSAGAFLVTDGFLRPAS